MYFKETLSYFSHAKRTQAKFDKINMISADISEMSSATILSFLGNVSNVSRKLENIFQMTYFCVEFVLQEKQ